MCGFTQELLRSSLWQRISKQMPEISSSNYDTVCCSSFIVFLCLVGVAQNVAKMSKYLILMSKITFMWSLTLLITTKHEQTWRYLSWRHCGVTPKRERSSLAPHNTATYTQQRTLFESQCLLLHPTQKEQSD